MVGVEQGQPGSTAPATRAQQRARILGFALPSEHRCRWAVAED